MHFLFYFPNYYSFHGVQWEGCLGDAGTYNNCHGGCAVFQSIVFFAFESKVPEEGNFSGALCYMVPKGELLDRVVI